MPPIPFSALILKGEYDEVTDSVLRLISLYTEIAVALV
jgi:hypothetical protein